MSEKELLCNYLLGLKSLSIFLKLLVRIYAGLNTPFGQKIQINSLLFQGIQIFFGRELFLILFIYAFDPIIMNQFYYIEAF